MMQGEPQDMQGNGGRGHVKPFPQFNMKESGRLVAVIERGSNGSAAGGWLGSKEADGHGCRIGKGRIRKVLLMVLWMNTELQGNKKGKKRKAERSEVNLHSR